MAQVSSSSQTWRVVDAIGELMMARSFVRGGLGYLLIPLAGILTPLLALPAVTARFGVEAWAAIAIGQSIGAAAATVVELGWGLNGPQRVAPMSNRAGYQLARVSIATKLIVLVPAAAVAATAAIALTPALALVAALTAVGGTCAGLTFTWFFLGKSRPWAVVGTDSLVRLAWIAIAAIAISVGGPVWVYPVAGLLIPSVLAPIVGFLLVRRETEVRSSRVRPRLIMLTIASQWSAVSARMVSALYIALPVTLVSIASPSSVALFAAGERLMRLSLSGLSIVPSAMQGWVGSGVARAARWRRAKVAVLINGGVGAVSAVSFGLLAPWASSLVFSGTATLTPGLAWLFASVILIICVSRATGGIALVALSRVQIVFFSAVAGGIAGVPAILGLSAVHGPAGGAIGEICAETIVLAVQVGGIVRARRRE